jgi:hypothetical protein
MTTPALVGEKPTALAGKYIYARVNSDEIEARTTDGWELVRMEVPLGGYGPTAVYLVRRPRVMSPAFKLAKDLRDTQAALKKSEQQYAELYSCVQNEVTFIEAQEIPGLGWPAVKGETKDQMHRRARQLFRNLKERLSRFPKPKSTENGGK